MQILQLTAFARTYPPYVTIRTLEEPCTVKDNAERRSMHRLHGLFCKPAFPGSAFPKELQGKMKILTGDKRPGFSLIVNGIAEARKTIHDIIRENNSNEQSHKVAEKQSGVSPGSALISQMPPESSSLSR